MNDTELIAKVAEKMGWVRRMDWDWLDHWKAPDRKRYSVVELPTTDQCLALLDKPWAMQQFSDGNVEFTIYDPEANKTWEAIEDMEPGMSQVQVRCRAILLALLEVK